jgi:hypothetical protein
MRSSSAAPAVGGDFASHNNIFRLRNDILPQPSAICKISDKDEFGRSPGGGNVVTAGAHQQLLEEILKYLLFNLAGSNMYKPINNHYDKIAPN